MNQIAVENDMFGKSIPSGLGFGKLIVTRGVQTSNKMAEILIGVRDFSDFSEDNDPHREHGFGQVIIEGTNYFWKIDYYDQNYEYGEYPNSENCKRVLTIMRADEY